MSNAYTLYSPWTIAEVDTRDRSRYRVVTTDHLTGTITVAYRPEPTELEKAKEGALPEWGEVAP